MYQLTPIESLNRSIKRYSSQFTDFKDGKCWDAWRMNALVTDIAQNVGNVTNPDCAPLTQEDAHLINKKHKFMHSMFSTDL